MHPSDAVKLADTLVDAIGDLHGIGECLGEQILICAEIVGTSAKAFGRHHAGYVHAREALKSAGEAQAYLGDAIAYLADALENVKRTQNLPPDAGTITQ